MRTQARALSQLLALWLGLAYGAVAATAFAVEEGANVAEGIRFVCPSSQLAPMGDEMSRYMAALGVSPEWVAKQVDTAQGTLTYTLNTPREDTNTLDLKQRPELGIRDEVVSLPVTGGKVRKVKVVSRKEILLAMLQHGRLTAFSCRIDALKDHIGVRQNTVAWASKMDLVWPEGESARWNDRYWQDGNPRVGVALHTALNDFFNQQRKYALGCYAAAKMVMIQGVLDYYRRVSRQPAMFKQVEDRLWADGEPLVEIEPGLMWSFEKDFDPFERDRPGKILKIQTGIPSKNFVPGDWAYLLNSDPVSARKIGYEGSNAIYMGGNQIVDLYNGIKSQYTFEQKMDEVYQWRNGVFNRTRDAARVTPLSPEALEGLRKTPEQGGLLMDFRVSHYLFGADALPPLPR